MLGAVIGSKIGAEIDNGDRGCMGHALELAGERKPVKWTNNRTGVAYVLTPTRNFGDPKNPCREFTTVAIPGGKEKGHEGKGKGKGKGARAGEASIKGVACRKGTGEWEFRT